MKPVLIYLFLSLFFMTKTYAQSKPWNPPSAALLVKNPIGDKTNVSVGKSLYAANCAACHGAKGKGNGLAASSLNPKPSDHTSAIVQNESDGSLFWKITEGRSPMPGFKQVLNDMQRWELVNFMRSLKAK